MNMAGNVEATAYWPGAYLSSQISMTNWSRFSTGAKLAGLKVGTNRNFIRTCRV